MPIEKQWKKWSRNYGRPTFLIKECLTCGCSFTAERHEQKYCSYECYWKTLKGKLNGRWLKNPPFSEERNCLTCGKTFLVRGSTKGQKFCSSKCYHSSPIIRRIRCDCRKGLKNSSKRLAVRKKIRKARLKQVFPKEDTIIEKIMESHLIKLGINYLKHTPIENICQPDFVLPERKVAIFADGDYWHANPLFYSRNDLDKIQKFNLKRDSVQNKRLKKKGWTVLRFWESQIKTNMNQILRILDVN